MPLSPRHTTGPNKRPHVFNDEYECPECGASNVITARVDFVLKEARSRFTCWMCKDQFLIARRVVVS